jgi:hypothetical protein
MHCENDENIFFEKKIQLDWQLLIILIDQLYTYAWVNRITSVRYATYYGDRDKKIRILPSIVKMLFSIKIKLD